MEILDGVAEHGTVTVEWQDDNETNSCNKCTKNFRVYRRRHHCRACGKIFCSNCCKDWILLPEKFGYPEPERCCISCVKLHGSLDWSKPVDIYGEHNNSTIVLLPPHLTTRKSMQLIAEHLQKDFRVITMDLPGLGTRRGEDLMMSTSVNALKDVIEKYCESKKVFVAGFGIGGYVAMVFARLHPKFCEALVLSGCCVEYPPIQSTIYTTTVGIVFKLTKEEDRWRIIPDTFDSIPRDIINSLILRDGIDYSQWGAFSKLVKEEKKGFYIECINKIQCDILFLNASNDYRNSESLFLDAAKNKGTLKIVDGDSMAFIDPDVSKLMANEISKFASC